MNNTHEKNNGLSERESALALLEETSKINNQGNNILHLTLAVLIGNLVTILIIIGILMPTINRISEFTARLKESDNLKAAALIATSRSPEFYYYVSKYYEEYGQFDKAYKIAEIGVSLIDKEKQSDKENLLEIQLEKLQKERHDQQ